MSNGSTGALLPKSAFIDDQDRPLLAALSLTLFRSEEQRAIGRSSYEKVSN
jgi:hypothetical protein